MAKEDRVTIILKCTECGEENYITSKNKRKHPERLEDLMEHVDNPELQMITEGSWEIAIYPHKPARFAPKDVAFIFFIEFNCTISKVNIDINAIFDVSNNESFIFIFSILSYIILYLQSSQ